MASQIRISETAGRGRRFVRAAMAAAVGLALGGGPIPSLSVSQQHYGYGFTVRMTQRQTPAGLEWQIAAPTVVITAVGTTQTRTAPCPIFLNIPEASTLGAGTWDTTHTWWTIDDPDGAIEHVDFTDPVTGQTIKWAPGTGELGIPGVAIGFVVENIAATITVTAHVMQEDGQEGSASITISNTGTPDIAYALRADSGYIRVGAGGNDSAPTGTGTAADPLYYATLSAAVGAASTGATILLNDDETHLVAGTISYSGKHNLVIGRFGGGTARPNLEVNTGSGIKICSNNNSQNMVIRGLQFTSNKAIGSTNDEAIEHNGSNLWVEDCVFNGALGGNAWYRAIAATNAASGLGVVHSTFGLGRGHLWAVGGVQTGFFAGNTCGASTGEHFARFLNSSTTPCRYINVVFNNMDYTGGSGSKGPLRFQNVVIGSAYHNYCVGGAEIAYDGAECSQFRFDGNYCETLYTSAVTVHSAAANVTIVNNRIRMSAAAKNGLFRGDSSIANPEPAGGTIRVFCNSITSELSTVFVPLKLRENTGIWTGTWAFKNNLVCRDVATSPAAPFFETSTDSTIAAFDHNLFPDVATSYVVAEIDGTKTSRTNFDAYATNQHYEAIDASDLIAASWRPNSTDHPIATAGAPTPAGVLIDGAFKPRGATSYIGAMDAVSSGATPPTGTLNAPPKYLASHDELRFSVTWTAATGKQIDVDTIDGSELEASAPGQHPGRGHVISVVPGQSLSDAQSVEVQYRLKRFNDAAFTSADDGTVTISVVAGELADTDGTFAAAGELGTLTIEIVPAAAADPLRWRDDTQGGLGLDLKRVKGIGIGQFFEDGDVSGDPDDDLIAAAISGVTEAAIRIEGEQPALATWPQSPVTGEFASLAEALANVAKVKYIIDKIKALDSSKELYWYGGFPGPKWAWPDNTPLIAATRACIQTVASAYLAAGVAVVSLYSKGVGDSLDPGYDVYASANVAEAAKLGLPVAGYLWDVNGHPRGKALSDAAWAEMLATARTLGATILVPWNFPGTYSSAHTTILESHLLATPDMDLTPGDGQINVALSNTSDLLDSSKPYHVQYRPTGETEWADVDGESPITLQVINGIEHEIRGYARGEGLDEILSPPTAIQTATAHGAEFDAPTAALAQAEDAVYENAGATSWSIKIGYSDSGSGINNNTIQTGNIRVTGPNGFDQLPVLSNKPARPVYSDGVATYTLTPPGGDWDSADNGDYVISMEPNQVRDADGNPVASGTLGSLNVYIQIDLDGPVLASAIVPKHGQWIEVAVTDDSPPIQAYGGGTTVQQFSVTVDGAVWASSLTGEITGPLTFRIAMPANKRIPAQGVVVLNGHDVDVADKWGNTGLVINDVPVTNLSTYGSVGRFSRFAPASRRRGR